MRAQVELNIPDDRIFLNFWNAFNGDDVVCELVDGRLMLSQRDEHGDELPPTEITISDFCEMVKTRVEAFPL